jgi:hypothetical protein
VTATGGPEKQVTFTIDNENNITAFATKQEAGGGESFSTQDELAGLAANWPANRLIEVWNGIPGLTPVKKFTNRKSAVARIWKALQSLDSGGATETVTAAPARANKAKGGAKKGKKVKASTKVPAKPAKGRKTATKPVVTREAARRPRSLAYSSVKAGPRSPRL